MTNEPYLHLELPTESGILVQLSIPVSMLNPASPPTPPKPKTKVRAAE